MSQPLPEEEYSNFLEEVQILAYKEAGLKKQKLDNENCDHVCTSECRRSGCNCKCGEFHNPKKKEEWVGTLAQWNKAGQLYEDYMNNI